MATSIAAIDLFAGAGGLSLGAASAGLDIKVAIENDKWAALTYQYNHRTTAVITADVKEVPSSLLRSAFKGSSATVLFGGPPCRGFSCSNQRTRNKTNPVNWLFMEFLRIVADLRPDWVVFENVKGLRETANGFFLQAVSDKLDRLGYRLTFNILNASNFGVPQHRERFFLVGSRHKLTISFADETPVDRVTVREALSDLPRLQNGASTNWVPYRRAANSEYALLLRKNLASSPNHLVTRNGPIILERFRHVPSGGNWEAIPRSLLANYHSFDCHTGLYHRLDASQPSIVIGNYRKNMLIHPREQRGLSVREAARLQSFPDDYEFKGSIGFQQQQVGNAVPPKLAAEVFARLAQLTI
ncbi:MAG TPA: DNA cytosine methyltransferase [Thermoanaerobaculia bacterium]|nr:DNA cytosine methyltransferase [Thermoanaerobaculia bacterium]